MVYRGGEQSQGGGDFQVCLVVLFDPLRLAPLRIALSIEFRSRQVAKRQRKSAK
jgi:hypothetical protein